jgi:hypothetical protein
MKQRNKNNKFVVSRIQKEILIGLILGDAHLEQSWNGLSYRMKIEQSLKKKEYVYHLYEIFKNWTLSQAKVKRDNLFFQTRFTKSLSFFGKQFYKEKKKVIPKLIHKWLTPRAIAYWYMDDGSMKSKQSKGVFFNTQCFTFKEVTLLSNILNKKYKLKTTLRRQKVGYQIYVSGYSYETLSSIIYPYLIDSMKYKFPLPRKKNN